MPGWLRSNFRTSKGDPVANKPVIQYLSALMSLRHTRRHPIALEYVKGHAGIEGNEGADQLANLGVGMEEVEERNWDALRERVEREMEGMAEEALDSARTGVPRPAMSLATSPPFRESTLSAVEEMVSVYLDTKPQSALISHCVSAEEAKAARYMNLDVRSTAHTCSSRVEELMKSRDACV